MDMPNDELDARITGSLPIGCGVSSQQKERMWENIYRRARTQSMLPPKAVSPHQQFKFYCFRLVMRVQNLVTILVTDEARYHRVYAHTYRYGGAQYYQEARFSFTIMALKYSF